MRKKHELRSVRLIGSTPDAMEELRLPARDGSPHPISNDNVARERTLKKAAAPGASRFRPLMHHGDETYRLIETQV